MKLIVPILLGLTLVSQAERHIVAEGETLFSLARRYQTSVTELQARNGLSSDLIVVGQALDVSESGESSSPPQPQPQSSGVYEVVTGDSLSVIAVRLGVSMKSLMAENGIANPDQLKVGQKLSYGGQVAVEPIPVPTPPPFNISLTSYEEQSVPEDSEVVIPGGSVVLHTAVRMQDLARRCGVSVEGLNEHNHWQVLPDSVLPVGLSVEIPPLVTTS